MKKMVLTKTSNPNSTFLIGKTFKYDKPVVGDRLTLFGMFDNGKTLKTSPIVDIARSTFYDGLGSTLTLKTKNSEYTFRVFGF